MKKENKSRRAVRYWFELIFIVDKYNWDYGTSSEF